MNAKFAPSQSMLRREASRFQPSLAIFVWGVWALLLLADLYFVAHFGKNIPYYDEWTMVKVLAGDQPVDPAWLWKEHNGHRIPIPKLLLRGLYAVSGWDFRVGMYFNVVLLASVAFAMIRVAGMRPGGMSHADAFFPLILLNWGHYENLLWTWQVTQVLPIVIACALLLIIVRRGFDLDATSSFMSGVCLVTLPLCGVPGLAFVPGFALWLGEVGRRQWTSATPTGHRQGLMTWSLAATALVLVPLYFAGLNETGGRLKILRESAHLAARALTGTTRRFLAGGLGPLGRASWPFSGWLIPALLLATLIMVMLSSLDGRPSIRSRARGMLAFFVAASGLTLSVGVGRMWSEFVPRYFLFAVPLLCWSYWAWELLGPPRAARLLRKGIFALAAFACLFNFQEGLTYGRTRAAEMARFERDILAGDSPSRLVAHHQRDFFPYPEDGGGSYHPYLVEDLKRLNRAAVGVFGAIGHEPDFHELRLTEVAVDRGKLATHAATEPAETAEADWTFREKMFIGGIRISRPPSSSLEWGKVPELVISWNADGLGSFSKERRFVQRWAPDEQETTFWIYEEVSQLRFAVTPADSVNPSTIVLLVPATPRKRVP